MVWFQGVSIAVVTENKDRGFAILGFFVAIKKEVSTSQDIKKMSLKNVSCAKSVVIFILHT